MNTGRARLAAVLCAALLPGTLLAQTEAPPPVAGPSGAKAEDNPTGWTSKAGLSYVQTGGNAEASTLGFKLSASHNWTRTFFTLQAGGVRSDTTFKEPFAVGAGDADFTVVENERQETTAENYFLDLNLDRSVSKRFYWQGGAGWLRNTFSGVNSREGVRAGVGYIWTDPDSKGVQLKTALLATLTRQDLTIRDPGTDETFVGARLLVDLAVPFGGKSTFNSRINLDENLQSTDDLRMTWWNSLGVSMTDRLGLQVSLLLLFDNIPALQELPLYSGEVGGAPVPPQMGTVVTPLRKWDQELSVSLVLNLVPKRPEPAPTGAP